MQTYRLEVKVSGWVTVEVEAESLEEAKEKAEPPWSMRLGQLQNKSAEVEDLA